MRLHSVVIGLISFGWACQSGPVETSAPPAAPAGAAVTAPAAAQVYGGSFEPATSVPLTTLLQKPQEYADKTVTTEGKVQRACTRKGCWMEIGEGDDACRVTFKDYGFFVPTDSAGAHARIQGKLATRVVEAAAVEHLESEGARFKNKKPDGSATEVRLIASAVELVR
jgi:hypothetical protein